MIKIILDGIIDEDTEGKYYLQIMAKTKKTKNIDIPKKIVLKLAKDLNQALGIPVHIVDSDVVENLVESIKRDEKIAHMYSDRDLYSEVSNFVVRLHVLPTKNNEELTERIKTFLNTLSTPKSYTAYIILRGVINFPVGLTLGNVKFIKPRMRDKKIRGHIENLRNNKNLSLVNPEDWNWIKVSFDSYKTINVKEALYEQLEIPYAIMSLFMLRGLDPTDNFGLIIGPNSVAYMEPKTPMTGWGKFLSDFYLKTVKKLASILNKHSRTNLEKKIINSIKVYGLSQLSKRTENRFLLIISACESLLLTNNDRDYLGLKLAEKTAFLLSDKGIQRKELFKRMRNSYNLRSRLIHSGESNINENDLNYLESIYKQLIIKLAQLSRRFDKMEKKSHEHDRSGIEDYIESLKFNIRMS